MKCSVCGERPAKPGHSRGDCGPCWRERARSAAMHYAPSRSKGAIDPDKQKRWDNRLEDYARVRAEGSQPPGTKRSDIELTKRVSDQLGRAVSAGAGQVA